MIRELRIVLPFTLDEWAIGHLYTSHRFRQQYESQTTCTTLTAYCYNVSGLSRSAVYAHKRYTINSFLPAWAETFIGSSQLVIESHQWDEYPRIRTIYTIPVVGNKVSIEIVSIHVDQDRGTQSNALGLDEKELRQRSVQICDIADDKQTNCINCSASDDPKRIRSKVTGRGPLIGEWSSTCTPHMCVYTIIRTHVRVWGIQNKAETFIVNELQEVYLKVLRMAFCWMDQWHGMSYEDALKLEVADITPRTLTLQPPPRSSSDPSHDTSVSKVASPFRNKLRSRL